jgi:hypothetical protein
MHPLTQDLSQLTDEELHSKRSDLQTKLSFAYRMGHSDMVNQLQLVLGDYAMEVEIRNQRMLEQAQKSGRLGKDDGSAKDITR